MTSDACAAKRGRKTFLSFFLTKFFFDFSIATNLDYGRYEMPTKLGRISEADIYDDALRLAKSQPNGWIATSDLITELTGIFQPQGEDAEILEGRHDTKFSQIVRNMISHKSTPTNIIALGYAEYKSHGLQITLAGETYLKSKGL